MKRELKKQKNNNICSHLSLCFVTVRWSHDNHHGPIKAVGHEFTLFPLLPSNNMLSVHWVRLRPHPAENSTVIIDQSIRAAGQQGSPKGPWGPLPKKSCQSIKHSVNVWNLSEGFSLSLSHPLSHSPRLKIVAPPLPYSQYEKKGKKKNKSWH